VIAGGCEAEERSQAAVIYFEFLLQHSPEGKEREATEYEWPTSQSVVVIVVLGEHRPAENISTPRKLPVRERIDGHHCV
jgi:hypothetical protein